MAFEALPPPSLLFPHSFTPAWSDWSLVLRTISLFRPRALYLYCSSLSLERFSDNYHTARSVTAFSSLLKCPLRGAILAPSLEYELLCMPPLLPPLPSVPTLIFVSLYSSCPYQALHIDSFLCSLSSLPLKNSRRAWNLSRLHNSAWNIVGTQCIFVESMN